MNESEKWKGSHSVVSNSSRPHGPQPTRLLHPWDFPGKSTGVRCHCLLQNPCMDSSKSNQYWPSWTVVELLAGYNTNREHFLTFSSVISSCKEDKLLFCFLEGKKAPKGRALSFTVWKKALKVAMQTRTNVRFQRKSSSHILWKPVFASLLYNHWMRGYKWGTGVSLWRDKRKAPWCSLLALASIFVQQNLKLFSGLNNRWHCQSYIFPGKKPLQFAISPSRRHQQFSQSPLSIACTYVPM